MIKKFFMISILSLVACSVQAVVSVGDGVTSETTFDFSIQSAIYNADSMQTWSCSADDLSLKSETVQKYGIAYTPFIAPDNSQGTASLISYPYISSNATITTVSGTELNLSSGVNPLLGKAFEFLTLVGSAPTVVCSDALNEIYYIQQVIFNDNAQGLNSFEGSSILNKFQYSVGQQIDDLAGVGAANLLVAYSASGFGTTPSGFSFLQLVTIPYNGFTYSSLQEQAVESIDTTTSVLTAGTTALTALGSSLSLHPSGVGLGMFAGFDVTAANADDGDRAVALCMVTGVNGNGTSGTGSLSYTSVIADDVAQESVQTPISCLRNQQTVVRNISTGYTSTGLGYLYVAQDDGAGGEQSIYAMPMVTMPATNINFGKVAAFDSVQTVFDIRGVTYRTQGFSQPLVDAQEIDITGAAPAQVTLRISVGGGPVPIASGGGYIEQLLVQGDSVYITIQEPFATGTTPGMFKSDAIFDETGRVMAWTSWQRVAGSQEQMLFAIKNRISSATMFVSGADSNNIEQTTWNRSGDFEELVHKVSGYLPTSAGGAQGIIPFPSSTNGFTGTNIEVSMVVTTGNNNVLVAQTGTLDVPTQTFQILSQSATTSIVLDDTLGLNIGSVVTAAFGNDGSANNWLFMGGDGGLSVLSHADGTGFTTLPNSGAALSLIDGDQTCKTLGNFSFVKKIVSDDTYVYVLTRSGVYRIELLASKFSAASPAPLNPELVVSASQLHQYAYCLDMIINQGFILLGTTAGLYSVNVLGGVPGTISQIDIPQGLPAVSSLQTISAAGEGFFDISNLYVLSIDFSTEQARLNRFVIQNGIVSPIQDQLLQGQDCPLVVFDYMSNNMFIDGTLGFVTSYKIGQQPPTIKYLQYILQAGASSRHFNLSARTSNISIALLPNSLFITGIVRDFASGSLLMAADFGLLADS